MKKAKLVIAGLTTAFAIGGVVYAAPAPKVFVCKYVGTPGVNETLQTGQNPISISSNAIANYQGVGSSFADAQGRSLVVAEDTGQPDPTCPSSGGSNGGNNGGSSGSTTTTINTGPSNSTTNEETPEVIGGK